MMSDGFVDLLRPPYPPQAETADVDLLILARQYLGRRRVMIFPSNTADFSNMFSILDQSILKR
jgi:hypothetical protein